MVMKTINYQQSILALYPIPPTPTLMRNLTLFLALAILSGCASTGNSSETAKVEEKRALWQCDAPDDQVRYDLIPADNVTPAEREEHCKPLDNQVDRVYAKEAIQVGGTVLAAFFAYILGSDLGFW
jgi:hypothetical protein